MSKERERWQDTLAASDAAKKARLDAAREYRQEIAREYRQEIALAFEEYRVARVSAWVTYRQAVVAAAGKRDDKKKGAVQ